jgi:predicted nucleic acid-binding protein
MTWVIAGERTPETLLQFEILSRQQAEAIVPAIWPEEIANVFLTMERAGKLTAAQVITWTDVLKNLPIEVCSSSIEESLGEVRLLAQAHHLTAYDARYLHLAMQEGLPLATRDKQLLAVARKVGVRLVGEKERKN